MLSSAGTGCGTLSPLTAGGAAPGPRGVDQAEEAGAAPRPGHQRAVRAEAGAGQRPLCRAQRLETPAGRGEEDPGQKGEAAQHQRLKGTIKILSTLSNSRSG